jgi:homopolymeric O-antigen transport system permease protein
MADFAILATSTNKSMTRRGFDDLAHGLVSWRIWHLMGIGTIRRRYSRSRIGQFWTTLSMGIMITCMGLIWSVLWKMSMRDIFPYIAVSIVLWTFLTGTIIDASTAIIGSSNYFLNQGMSFSTPIFAALYSQFIILLHNMVIVALILVIFPQSFSLEILMVIPGFFLTMITIVWVSCLVAILCARYRDVIQLVAAIINTAFYISPVIFKADFIPPEYRWINFVNPFAIFLSIMRDPLFGRAIPWEYWAIAVAITIIGTIFTLALVGRFSKRVIFWI